mmetsp:Transcript_63724/g.105218  ORF Transcript_63724/g.105218 Transcript_63724/m.105218 type:complete len:200 (-) Transcript_63724:1041-1640(-)
MSSPRPPRPPVMSAVPTSALFAFAKQVLPSRIGLAQRSFRKKRLPPRYATSGMRSPEASSETALRQRSSESASIIVMDSLLSRSSCRAPRMRPQMGAASSMASAAAASLLPQAWEPTEGPCTPEVRNATCNSLWDESLLRTCNSMSTSSVSALVIKLVAVCPDRSGTTSFLGICCGPNPAATSKRSEGDIRNALPKSTK